MNNTQVARAWVHGEAGRSLNMRSDGHRLYSYDLCIGEWCDGLPIVFNYTARYDTDPFGKRVPSLGFHSTTTSRHVGLARQVGGYSFDKWDRRVEQTS